MSHSPNNTYTQPAKFLVIGDLCVDVFMQVAAYPAEGGDGTVQRMHQHAGGSAANTAIALARLGGAPILLTHTGKDTWAQQVLPVLQQSGVVVDHIVQEENAKTGLTFLVVSQDAERTMFTYRGANRNLQPEEINEELFEDVCGLHISSYACLAQPQSEAVLKAVGLAQQRDVTISLDVGVEPASMAGDLIRQLLPSLSLIILGDPEAIAITNKSNLPDALNALIESGVKLIGLKLGKAGCRLLSKDQDINLNGFSVEAIDSTGAGDAFCAGMLHGITHQWSQKMSGTFANALGALVTTRWGAGEELPTLKEVLAFLQLQKNISYDPIIEQILKQLERETEVKNG
jgi:ribokinase